MMWMRNNYKIIIITGNKLTSNKEKVNFIPNTRVWKIFLKIWQIWQNQENYMAFYNAWVYDHHNVHDLHGICSHKIILHMFSYTK